jgi:hypothetical protein
MQINYGEIFENNFDGSQIKFLGANRIKKDLVYTFEYIQSITKRGKINFTKEIWERMNTFNNWRKVNVSQ